jgi:hypothetical protein
MERNQNGDTAKVKDLLQKIVNEKLAGNDVAAEWLRKL